MMGLPPARVLSGYGIVIGWWLRSPGSSASSAANVNNNGSLGNNNNVNNDNEVVRPAFPNCLKFVPAKDDPVPEKAVLGEERNTAPFRREQLCSVDSTRTKPSEKYADGGPDGRRNRLPFVHMPLGCMACSNAGCASPERLFHFIKQEVQVC